MPRGMQAMSLGAAPTWCVQARWHSSYVQLSEAGRTVEDGYDWSQDALHPGERGEVLKVDRDGWVTVTGQFNAHDFMNSRHTFTEKCLLDEYGKRRQDPEKGLNCR